MTKKDDFSLYPTIPAMIGKDLYLKVMDADDFETTYLWFLHSDPQSQTCHQPILTTPRDMSENVRKKEKNPNAADFIIILKENNRPVGKLRYFNLNMLNRSAELAYLVAPDDRGKGYAKEALRLLIRYLFIYLGLNKVYAQTASFNEPSVKLLKSLDFRLDGTLRQHHFYKGNLHDDLLFSLLKFECNFVNE